MLTSRSVPGTAATLQNLLEPQRIQPFAGVVVTPDRGRCREHRVEHRLLGGIYHALEQLVEPAPADPRAGRSRAVPVGSARGGRGQEDLTAAVVRRRS